MADPHRSRVDRIVDYLRAHRDEIDLAPSGSLAVDYNGGDVTVKIGRVDRLREPPSTIRYAVMD